MGPRRGPNLRKDVARKYLHDLAALYDWFVSFGATSPKSFFMFRVAFAPRSVDLGFLKFGLLRSLSVSI